MTETIADLLKLQEELLSQTRKETEAKLQVVKTTEELIKIQKEYQTNHEKIDAALKLIIEKVTNLVPLKNVESQLDLVVNALHILITAVMSINGVSLEQAKKLESQLLLLAMDSISKNKAYGLHINKSEVSINEN